MDHLLANPEAWENMICMIRILYIYIYIVTQSVSTPNGLIAHMFGPLEGRRHDAFMLSVSGLPNKLRLFNRPDGHPYVLYGDPAYGVMRNILSP